MNFDGYISKEDLNKSLIQLIQIPSDEIIGTKLDRLFNLMDFFKQKKIQLSDFQRLVGGVNPYNAAKVPEIQK